METVPPVVSAVMPQRTFDTAVPPSIAPEVAVAPEVPLPPPLEKSWLSAHVPNVIALLLTVMLCYLAWVGNEKAQDAIVTAFALLAGGIWAARYALKRPGIDG